MDNEPSGSPGGGLEPAGPLNPFPTGGGMWNGTGLCVAVGIRVTGASVSLQTGGQCGQPGWVGYCGAQLWGLPHGTGTPTMGQDLPGGHDQPWGHLWGWMPWAHQDTAF